MTAPARAADQLLREYREVAEELDRLAAARGEEVARPLRDRFFAIPLSDSLRVAAIGEESKRRLDALRKDLPRAAGR